MKTKIIKYCSIFILIIATLCIIYFAMVISPFVGGILSPPDSKKMEKYFLNNSNEMCNIGKYLKNENYQYIRIDKNEGTDIMYVKDDENIGKNILIEDDSIKECINILYNCGFRVIEKNSNYVQFSRWSSLDSSRGVVYSFIENKPYIDHVTELTPLSVDDWYYYEHNIEKSK